MPNRNGNHLNFAARLKGTPVMSVAELFVVLSPRYLSHEREAVSVLEPPDVHRWVRVRRSGWSRRREPRHLAQLIWQSTVLRWRLLDRACRRRTDIWEQVRCIRPGRLVEQPPPRCARLGDHRQLIERADRAVDGPVAGRSTNRPRRGTTISADFELVA